MSHVLPAWIAPGVLAEYPARTLGAAARDARLITSYPWQLASGEWVIKLDGVVGCVPVDAVAPARAVGAIPRTGAPRRCR